MNPDSAAQKRASWTIPLAVILALIGAFFLGSRFSYIPKQVVGSSVEPEEWRWSEPRVRVWISKDKLFVWNHEPAKPIEQLSARIKEYRAKHQSGSAAISTEDLTRFEDVVTVLTELRKSDFTYVTLETRSARIPSLATK